MCGACMFAGRGLAREWTVGLLRSTPSHITLVAQIQRLFSIKTETESFQHLLSLCHQLALLFLLSLDADPRTQRLILTHMRMSIPCLEGLESLKLVKPGAAKRFDAPVTGSLARASSIRTRLIRVHYFLLVLVLVLDLTPVLDLVLVLVPVFLVFVHAAILGIIITEGARHIFAKPGDRHWKRKVGQSRGAVVGAVIHFLHGRGQQHNLVVVSDALELQDIFFLRRGASFRHQLIFPALLSARFHLQRRPEENLLPLRHLLQSWLQAPVRFNSILFHDAQDGLTRDVQGLIFSVSIFD
mmetsp:Transcript_14886/g.23660  ORF Transcript_14886/g.23660 Transcript_14886/m.23660 type:complete len:298 (-) Transcript_14886:465-1358(-)